jgi:hypothetical protein
MPQEKRADSQKCSTTQKRKPSKKEAHILLTECVLFFCFLIQSTFSWLQEKVAKRIKTLTV